MRKQLFNIDTALLTQRCVVRRFRENEGAIFQELVYKNRDILQDHFPLLVGEVADSHESTEVFVRQRIAGWLLQTDFAFGIWHNESTEMIGYVHLFNVDWDVPSAEMSFFLDRDLAKQGLMTEVLARVIRFGFKQLEMEKLYIRALTDNYDSHRLARRIGFSREGDLRNEFRKPGGTLVDLVRFGFSRETYGE